MFKVEYEEIAIIIINNFINWYLNGFLVRFNDSWIYEEDIITDNYSKKSLELKKSIFDKIQDTFWKTEILGYKPLKNNRRKSWILIWNYRIFIEYTENFTNKTRIIEKIEFNKK
jgi:hypothetical protein